MTVAPARPWLAALVLVAGCSAGDPRSTAGPDLVALLPPAAELDGWAMADGPAEHRPDTLYEVLDGGAERYLSHGFVRLVGARYQLGDDPLASVRLDLFDMGSELGAFGIFSAGRPTGVEPRPWGAAGYRSGTVAAAYRGRVFVHGEADDDRPELAQGLETLVARVADRATGPTSPPAILDPLPTTGRVPASERYVPADLLGHAFLPGGVTAEYETHGDRVELFFSDLGDRAAATRALAALREHVGRRSSVSVPSLEVGDGGFAWTDPVLGGGAAVRVGRFVAGFRGEHAGEADSDRLSELAAALATR